MNIDEYNHLLKWSEDLKPEIESLPFDKKDIRLEFFGMLYDIASNYYRGNCVLEISEFIKNQKVMFDPSLHAFGPHISRIGLIRTHPGFIESYFNSLNRNLAVSSWSNFEFCVTTLCNRICNAQETESLLNHQLKDILKHLSNSTISEEDLKSLKTAINKDHLTHVPITRKTDLLFKKTIGYKRNITKDKDFLVFFGKLRNAMHTNFIYLGKDYSYTFNNHTFLFKNNENISISGAETSEVILFCDLIDNLKTIWKEIVLSIEHPERIPYLNED